jgi:hypothetical protein
MEHEFTLVLSGIYGTDQLTSKLVDAMFEACGDAALGMRSGRPFIDFLREAASLKEAILSAVRDVRAAGLGLDVMRVEWSPVVSQGDIARRIGKSRQMVHQYIRGVRGPSGFPPSVFESTQGQPLWHWCDVAAWLVEHDMVRPNVLEDAQAVDTINSVLDYEWKTKHQAALTREVKSAMREKRIA